MSKYLQKKFALSEQGGRDLTKAIFSCAITNMGLIFPMGILFLFMERLLGPLVGLQAPSLGMAGYVAVCIVLLVIIFIFWRIQYDATFVASYTESANMRIRGDASFLPRYDKKNLPGCSVADHLSGRKIPADLYFKLSKAAFGAILRPYTLRGYGSTPF